MVQSDSNLALYGQCMLYKIIKFYCHTQLSVFLEVLVVYLATCFGLHTEPSSG